MNPEIHLALRNYYLNSRLYLFRRTVLSGWLINFILLFACNAYGQTDIPVGTWRMHLSYNTINSIAIAENNIYAAAESGVMVIDKADNSISTYNTLNALSSTGISHIAFDAVSHQLLVAYSDGGLDIIKNDKVINFNRLKTSTDIVGSKRINHISIKDNFAYLAADFGVVVFDLVRLELKETWRDLGLPGENLKIVESTFINDSIFLATENGILAGDLNDNLLDFNYWRRFNTGDFANPINGITIFDEKIYAAINEVGIYHYQNGSWTKDIFAAGNFISLTATSEYLFIAEGGNLTQMDKSGNIVVLESDLISAAQDVKADDQGTLWIADLQNGLVSNITGNYVSYMPDGPSITSAFRLKFIDHKMFAVSGGFSSAATPLKNQGILNVFSNGAWEATPTAVADLTDVDLVDNQLYVSSFGEGLQRSDDAGNKTIFDNANSPLKSSLPAETSIDITSIERSGNQLWVANAGTETPLHVLQNEAWQSFSFAIPAANYPVDLAVDFSGNIWMTLDPSRGGGIMIVESENNIYKTEVTGNGALPSRSVTAIAIDREGYAWIGTDEGVAYFFSPFQDAVKPIFENRFLLRDEKITAIEVDGGNRKWIGTQRGAWLFNPAGDELISHFTTTNSPLLSDVILDIEINSESGEVFFSTDKGIISYRADATTSELQFGQLKIFPNPVTPEFSGTVGIMGLATDAIVKITDISGKLIWQTQANGGMATWTVRDYNGRRAATGIYLVFATTEDGSESVVGKIAVVD